MALGSTPYGRRLPTVLIAAYSGAFAWPEPLAALGVDPALQGLLDDLNLGASLLVHKTLHVSLKLLVEGSHHVRWLALEA